MAIRSTVSYSGYVAQSLASSATTKASGCRLFQDIRTFLSDPNPNPTPNVKSRSSNRSYTSLAGDLCGASNSPLAIGFSSILKSTSLVPGSNGSFGVSQLKDLRTGRSVVALEGHVKPIYGISFSPNGHHLATGGDDNTCRIWDLRKKKSLYTIPAHSKLISQVKFEPQDGYFLLTASHDMTAKVWSSRDFKPVKTLSGHEDILTSLDVVADGQYVATVSRHIKLWSCRDTEKAAGKGMEDIAGKKHKFVF